jgi:hypothetical protein
MQQNADETPEQWRVFFSVLFLVGAFAVMILGMVSKVYYDHLTKNMVFSLSQIVLPMLVAPIVYGAIYASLKSSTDVIPALILAFQNGFFWQDVLGGIKPAVGGAEPHAELVPTFLSSLF